MFLYTKVITMQNPRNLSICSKYVLQANHLIHMYYIFIYKIYIYKYFKEKTNFNYSPTTPTTSLKRPPPLVKNVVPTLFLCGYYNLLQPTTI